MLEPSSHGTVPPSRPIRRSPLLARQRLTVVLLALIGAIGTAWSIRHSLASSARTETIGYTELLAHGTAADVVKAEIDGERGLLKLKNGATAMAVGSNAHSPDAGVRP